MKKLPLPSPRSPKGLDEKILTYAKQKQPVEKAHRPTLWLSGLAMASIVGITVMIALPTQQRMNSAGSDLAQPAASPVMDTQPRAKSAEFSKRSGDHYEMAPQAGSVQSAFAEITADEVAEELAGDWLHQRFLALYEELENGDPALARRNYQVLKNQCKKCDLPNTLEEALKSMSLETSPR